MIFSPIAGRPLITQGFGQNPELYSQWGFKGHNGLDFGVPVGTMVYSPHDGIATVVDDGEKGYGKHVIIKADNRKSVLAHLSVPQVEPGQFVYQGDPIGLSGNSGFSTGPHLHWTFKILKNGVVQLVDNGYKGAVDVSEFTRMWEDTDLHRGAKYTDFAKEYLSATFSKKEYLKRDA
jgi:murein DD-endopeptidase MepM/ murein hydrolase activator NlpD